MLLKEDIKYQIIEGYLSQLEELTFPGGAKNYMPIQFLVMFLFGGNPITKLSPELFQKISFEYPKAVHQVLGNRENLDSIAVPPFGPAYKNNLSDIWNSVPDEEKSKINAIYYTIKNNIGA